jgi:non-ribosomal peptide synthetase component F
VKETESNAVAEFLINNSVSFGHYVGIYDEHTSRMVIGILGIMKAEAAYCALSDDYPIYRIRSIIEEAGIEMVLLQSRNDVLSSQVLEGAGLPTSSILGIEEICQYGMATKEPRLVRPIRPSDPAFLIFTSGSTGRPKGVAVRHGSLRYQIRAHVAAIDASCHARVILLSTIVFDMHSVALFQSIFCGCTVFLASKVSVVILASVRSLTD